MMAVTSTSVRRALGTTALAVAVALTGAGCTGGNSIADQARSGRQAGFVAGDGTIERIAADKRGEPISLSGSLLDGTAWTSTSARGKVVVINVWASWCEPCEAEAPHLVAAAKSLSSNPRVSFIGIDVGESAATGAAAAQRQGLPYPSLSDNDRATGAALQNRATAPPTTLVLDGQGRIAARISGPITTPSTLTGLVQDVLADNA